MQSRQLGFTIVLVDHLLKTKKECKILEKQEIHNVFIKANQIFGDIKDFSRRTVSNKVLHDKLSNVAKNLKYDGYQRGLLWFMV